METKKKNILIKMFVGIEEDPIYLCPICHCSLPKENTECPYCSAKIDGAEE